MKPFFSSCLVAAACSLVPATLFAVKPNAPQGNAEQAPQPALVILESTENLQLFLAEGAASLTGKDMVVICFGQQFPFSVLDWKELVAALPQDCLVVLNFRGSALNDGDFQAFLDAFPGFLCLNIQDTAVRSIAPLLTPANQRRVLLLNVNSAQLGDTGLDCLSCLTALRGLSVGESVDPAVDPMKDPFFGIAPMTRENIYACIVESPTEYIPADLSFAAGMTGLASLSLPGYSIPSFEPLAELPNLKDLKLGSLKSDTDLTQFRNLKALTSLRLEDEGCVKQMHGLLANRPPLFTRLQIWRGTTTLKPCNEAPASQPAAVSP